MLVTYTAIDGFSLSAATGAWLMADTAANMINDQTANSPTKTLTENGTVTTSAVATNSSTLAASAFSSSNYYSLAYDADLNPGTSGLSLSAWFYGTFTSSDYIVERDSAPSAQRYVIFTNADGTISARVDDNTTVRTATTTAAYNDNQWHLVTMVFDGTDLDIYIDGAFADNATGTALNTLSNGTAVLRIGEGINSSAPFNTGGIAGVELIIGAQYTAQGVKSKYELEKVLFNQLETFSIVGQSIEYEVDLITASIANTVSENFTETLDGSRDGLTWYRKKGFACTTIPFSRSSLPEAYKFLKSTNNVPFTYDERGSLLNSPTADNPITVYKTSANETIQFNNPFYSYSFSLREV